MNRRRPTRSAVPAAAALALLGAFAWLGCRSGSGPAATAGAAAASPAGGFTIRDVRLFDGERVVEHRSVVVAGGRIVRVGGPEVAARGAQVDGRGRTLLPGLVDAHVHIGEDVEGALGQAASLGVTTVIDMFNGGERFAKILRVAREDPPNLAAVLTAGVGATAPGGHPTQMGGPPFATISRPADAQAFVDSRFAEGSNFLKIIYDDLRELGFQPLPMLDRETLAALVRAAHRRGKVAVVHIGSERQAREVIEAGADGLAHLFIGEEIGEGFGELARRHGTFVIPTLSTLALACGRSDGPALLADERLRPFIRPESRDRLGASWRREPKPCRATVEAVRQLVAAGARILAGTDAPIPGTTYGASLHGELALLVQDGLTPIQALAAATSASAVAFGLEDRGFVRRGLRADLVLVEGDPTADIFDTRRIVSVWKAGVEVQRSSFP